MYHEIEEHGGDDGEDAAEERVDDNAQALHAPEKPRHPKYPAKGFRF